MSLTVDTSKLKEAFRRFNTENRPEMAKVLREQGRGLAMELARKTAPATFGDSDQVFENASNKVEGEIRRVYKPIQVAAKVISESLPPGKKKSQNARQAARAFAQVARTIRSIRGKSARSVKKRYAAAETATGFLERLRVKPFIYTTVGPFDGGEAHQAARFGKYRRVPKNQYVRVVPLEDKRLDAYVKRKLSHIGMSKAGWVHAARDLGGDQTFRSGTPVSMPKWVKRHKKRAGYAIDKSQDPRTPSVSVTNTIPWISAVLSKDSVNDSLFYRRLALVKRLGYVLRQSARKAGL